jgi:HK97 family phage major capsid protein
MMDPMMGSGQVRRPEVFKPAGAPGRSFIEMFYQGQSNVSLNWGGFKNSNEFFTVLESGRYDDRLIQAVMTEGSPSEGGFSVLEPLSAKWLDMSLMTEIVRPRATVWPMTSSTLKVPGWDMLNMTGGQMFGGFGMEMVGEGGTATVQGGKLRVIQLTCVKGMIYTEVSGELSADGLNFEQQLEMALVSSISYGMDKQFIRGTGASQALGILNSNSLITVSKQAGQLQDTIVYENLADMWARMYPEGRKRCVWIANHDCLPQLLQCSIPLTGVAGQFYPVMNETNGRYFIFGQEVLFSPVMSALGDLGDIALVDLSQYCIGIRKEMSIDRSIHPGFQRDVNSYRIIVRFDGQPAWNSTMTPEYGAAMYWAVCLEDRT